MRVSPFPLERQASVRPMREPAQAGQFRILTLAQTREDPADHAIHAIRRLTLGNTRPPRHLFRDFRLLHPISIYQRGAPQKPLPAPPFCANSFILRSIMFYCRPVISGDRTDEPILIAA
jgi:hypothetical protein